MRRKAQLWRFVDADDKPAAPIDGGGLHRLLLATEASGGDLAFTDAFGYETHVVAAPGSAPQFAIHRIRSSDLPSERRDGRIVNLNKRVRELAEGTNVWLPTDNLVVFMGTGYSPRPGRFAEWLRERVGWPVWLEPVVRRDLGAVLANLRKVSSVELKIFADDARRLDLSAFFDGESDPLAPLLAAQKAHQGGIITVGWSVGQGQDADQGFFRSLLERLRLADLSLFRSARAKVYVEDVEGAVPIDFLHDRLVTEVEVDPASQRQRLLDWTTAQDAMEQAWRDFQEAEPGLRDIRANSTSARLRAPRALLPRSEE
jgi:hypothetical protein